MNRRGQTVVVGFMISVMLFLAVVTLIEPLKDSITDTRSPEKLDCSNSSISVGSQMTCILVDSYLPIFIGFGIAIAIAYMGLKDRVTVG